jgi:16S rRNA (cytidine1402-2'-O)-methyltransferase
VKPESSESVSGVLFVVATPIGNLGDMSPRARQVLESVDLIAAEDTRHTGRLLSHFGAKTAQIALHDHNEEKVIDKVIGRLKSGMSVALVSDAGTPLVSDPGFRLVQEAHAQGISVSPIPGPSAVISAISVAGLPSDRFCFEGFLPSKREARLSVLRNLSAEIRTMVFLESVHRIESSLEDIGEVFGADRETFLGRELTKLHEQCVFARLSELKTQLAEEKIPHKGEFVLVVHGAKLDTNADPVISVRLLLSELLACLPGKQAVDIVARVGNQRRNDVYKLMLELRSKD